MPDEKNPAAAKPRPVVITNQIEPQAGNTAAAGDFAPERVDLPSAPAGKALYPASPAAFGFVNVRPITTVEEEILATPRFWAQGVAIDMVLSKCILTKGINTLDLVSGDRSHILFYLRTISYGPKYTFRVVMKDGVEQEVETDVSKLKVRQASPELVEPFTFQVGGVTYQGRLSRGHDEAAIIQSRLRVQRDNPKGGAEPAPRETLKRLLVSVNGSTDAGDIERHINGLIAGNAQKVRRELAKGAPGLDMEVDVTNDRTGELEKVQVSITESFFRSDD
jgi:hypothetical protein